MIVRAVLSTCDDTGTVLLNHTSWEVRLCGSCQQFACVGACRLACVRVCKRTAVQYYVIQFGMSISIAAASNNAAPLSSGSTFRSWLMDSHTELVLAYCTADEHASTACG
jgi:hypothetical protein